MTGSRCPACGASTPDGAQWCSLCYTDLRPAPAVDVPAATAQPPAPAPIAATGVAVDHGLDPLTAPIAALLEVPAGGVTAVAPAAAAPAPAATAAPALPGVVVDDPEIDPTDGITWPCQRCGASVALALDACPECGAGFLSGAVAGPDLTVPIVGNLTRLSGRQRFGLAAALATGLIVVFLVIVVVGAALL